MEPKEKVSMVIVCKCGSSIFIEELKKVFDKFFCPKCDREIKNIINK